MSELGKLEKVNLRDVWKNEEYDFSAWLSRKENLNELGKTIGMDIVLQERESSVGKYSVDIFGYEEESNRKVVIENQLEATDHDHLGKIITYASGKDANTIIWIVRKANEEHRQAIDWLNNHTDEDIGFFLIEIQLWRIGDSEIAPKFNIISKPNDWGKTVKSISNLTKTKNFQFEFWSGFANYGDEYEIYSREFNKRKALPQHWYSIAAGSSEYHFDLLCVTPKNEVGIDLYIDSNKEVYDRFYLNKNEIELETGLNFDWQRLDDKKSSKIRITKKVDFSDSSKFDEYYKWLCDTALVMKKKFNKVYNK